MMDAQVHFSFLTLVIYLLLSITGWYCATRGYKAKKNKKRIYYGVWFLAWLIPTVFRVVNNKKVGGTDAYSYIFYFHDCLNPNTTSIYSYRTEPFFRLCNHIIRSLTDNYHIYFIIVYSIIVGSFIYFIDYNLNKQVDSVMLLIMFYTYLTTFSILRSGLSIAFFVIGFVLLEKNKYLCSSVAMVVSVLMHTASIVYAGFYVFFMIYKKDKRPRLTYALMYALGGYVLAIIVRTLTLQGILTFNLGQPVDVYLSASVQKGFWVDYWKIVVTQLILCVVLLVLRTKVNKYFLGIEDIETHNQFKIIYLGIVYDLMVIPFTYVIDLWRGIDYFFLPRLIMWGYIISVIKKMVVKEQRGLVTAGFGFVGVAYMIFRICNDYAMVGTMPYIFEPLYKLLG